MSYKKFKGFEYERLIQDHSTRKNVDKSSFLKLFQFKKEKKNATEYQETNKTKSVENPCYNDNEPLIQL